MENYPGQRTISQKNQKEKKNSAASKDFLWKITIQKFSYFEYPRVFKQPVWIFGSTVQSTAQNLRRNSHQTKRRLCSFRQNPGIQNPIAAEVVFTFSISKISHWCSSKTFDVTSSIKVSISRFLIVLLVDDYDEIKILMFSISRNAVCYLDKVMKCSWNWNILTIKFKNLLHHLIHSICQCVNWQILLDRRFSNHLSLLADNYEIKDKLLQTPTLEHSRALFLGFLLKSFFSRSSTVIHLFDFHKSVWFLIFTNKTPVYQKVNFGCVREFFDKLHSKNLENRAICEQFGPSGYNIFWISNKLNEKTRLNYILNFDWYPTIFGLFFCPKEPENWVFRGFWSFVWVFNVLAWHPGTQHFSLLANHRKKISSISGNWFELRWRSCSKDYLKTDLWNKASSNVSRQTLVLCSGNRSDKILSHGKN